MTPGSIGYTLKIQYRLVDHLFVHTEKMKRELMEQFDVSASAISVIPFGINNAVPDTNLKPEDARRRLGIPECDRVILFLGISPHTKGSNTSSMHLNVLWLGVEPIGSSSRATLRTAKITGNALLESLIRHVNGERILRKIENIPDDQTEVYFKAAEVLVLALSIYLPEWCVVFGVQFRIASHRDRCGDIAGRHY